MHGYIYEYSSVEIEPEEWASEYDFNDCPHVDYVRETDVDERLEAIENLQTQEWLNDLFIVSENPNVLVFKGEDRLKGWRDFWIDKIRRQLDLMEGSKGSFSQFSIRNTMDTGFFGDNILFYKSGHSCYDITPNHFFDYLHDLKNGDVVYISSVFDYHY